MGAVTHIASLGIHINGHKEGSFFVTRLGQYPQVMVIPWMQLDDLAIRFASNSLTFGSHYCLSPCKVRTATPITAKCISIPLPKCPTAYIAMNSTIAMRMLSRKKCPDIHTLSLYWINKGIGVKNSKIQWKSQIPTEYHDFLDLFDETLGRKIPPTGHTTTASPSLAIRNPPSIPSMVSK